MLKYIKSLFSRNAKSLFSRNAGKHHLGESYSVRYILGRDGVTKVYFNADNPEPLRHRKTEGDIVYVPHTEETVDFDSLWSELQDTLQAQDEEHQHRIDASILRWSDHQHEKDLIAQPLNATKLPDSLLRTVSY